MNVYRISNNGVTRNVVAPSASVAYLRHQRPSRIILRGRFTGMWDSGLPMSNQDILDLERRTADKAARRKAMGQAKAEENS